MGWPWFGWDPGRGMGWEGGSSQEPSLSREERGVRVLVLARVLCGSGEENGLAVVRMGRWWGNADRAGSRGGVWGGKGELEPSLPCEEREVRVVVLVRVLCGSGGGGAWF